MPGIYSKPPRRAEYASDTRCLVQAATERFASGKNWEAYVHTLVDEMEAERNRAREEAFRECGVVKGTLELNDSVPQKKKIQQAVARKEMEVAEVFFECGVHEFFCKVLGQAGEEMSSAHTEQLLSVYQVLQLIELDPFDDDMGLVSLLNYFLSERHSYYVDIHWRDSELSHMQIFLSALLRFISFRASDDCPSMLSHSTASDISQEARKVPRDADTRTSLQLTALRLLHATLWTFPPHRVVSRMALAFSRAHCSELLRSFSRPLASTECADEEILRLQVQAIAAVAFFGLGPSLTRRAVQSALCWSCSSFACREERCPCSTCEFQRRLLKLIRNRDELGVQASSDAKRQICYSLVRAGISSFLAQALVAVATAAAAKRQEGNAKGGSLPAETVNCSQAIAWILLLCSWAYEDVHQGESILTADNMNLLSSALHALEAIYADSPNIDLFCEDGPSSLLRVITNLILRTKATERSGLMLVARPVLASIASSLCTLLVDLRPGSRSNAESDTQLAGSPSPVPANDASLNPQERALTTSLIFFSLMELLFDFDKAPNPVAGENKAQDQASQTPASTVEMAIQACQSLIDIYEYLHPRFASLKGETNAESAEFPLDSSAARVPLEVTGQAGFEPRAFFLGVVGTMAVSVGAVELQGVDQMRWRFVPNPAVALQPAQAGGFASSARQLLSHYKKTQDEGCQIVKKLAGLVILRSEQAAGMVLRAGKQSS